MDKTTLLHLIKTPQRLVGRGATGDPVNNLNRQLFQLAWPSLIESILQTMLGFVDLVMVGKLGADAIAGVGLGGRLMMLLQVLFTGLSVGNTALVARAVGAKDKPDAERIAKQSLVFSVIPSAIIALIGLFFSEPIIAAMGATGEVTAIGAGFLRIVSVFSIFMAIMMIGGGTLRGSGDTRTPLMITAVINVINIVFAYLLIFGHLGFPKMGPIGSAAATTIARGVGSALMLYVLFRRGSILKLPLSGGWGLSRTTLARLLNVGGPAAIEQIVFQLGLLAFGAMTISMGTAALAAQQIAFNIASISMMPAFAFGVAATTLVGQSLGAKDPDRAEAAAWQAQRGGMIWMVLMGIAFFIWRRPLLGLFTSDPTVTAFGEMGLIFIAVTQPMQSISMVAAGALRGAGDTRATMIITTVSVWFVRVALGYLLAIVLGIGFLGIWIGWMADWTARAVLIFIRFRSGKWKTVRV
jgi:putative MATE family efflux protein